MKKDPADVLLFLQKHVILKCEECNHDITGHEVAYSISISASGSPWQDFPCWKCGYRNSALKNRNYGVAQSILNSRLEYSYQEILDLSTKKCFFPKKIKDFTVECGNCYPCGARKIVFGT